MKSFLASRRAGLTIAVGAAIVLIACGGSPASAQSINQPISLEQTSFNQPAGAPALLGYGDYRESRDCT